MVTNPKREALERLSGHVSRKNSELGFSTNAPSWLPWTSSPGQEHGSAINAPDTWAGPLADTSTEDTKLDVDAVDSIFSNLLDAINEQKNSLPEDIDESDPAAEWPN
ncbi:hypothetical protein [Actinomyces glycerinitolerans]|uniref:Uncharacterized protein n=1 Tax=Actinomyces glycerinitolerans TaxID=1892869 RepID=A0A1M4S2U7_9ACTO|nr:hypothetical protein [Actinomyces glycerinitolerans]SHE26327.1 Hypothetical protein ACGLYG10_2577 [Actinomyces glycerinitolerans]